MNDCGTCVLMFLLLLPTIVERRNAFRWIRVKAATILLITAKSRVAPLAILGSYWRDSL